MLSLALTACGKSSSTPKSGTDGTELPNGASGGSGGTADPSGVAGDAGGAGGELSSRALSAEMRRLTAAEYRATVGDVLGTKSQPRLAEFGTVVDGFDNNAAANGVDEALYLRYLETAETLADEVFATTPLREKIVVCEETDSPDCIARIVSQTGRRLFRRPLLTEEINTYQKVYARARTRLLAHPQALRDVLVALLSSAQFLYRVEPAPGQPGPQPVDQYALAARLSYLLWSSTPDDALLDAAANAQLESEEQLTQTVKRLLDDPRSVRLAENFAGQWLGARDLLTRSFGADFPEWTPQVSTAAATEIHAWFYELVQQNHEWARFFDSPVHFINVDSAPLYGLKAQTTELERVELSEPHRHGFLSLLGFLAQAPTPSRSGSAARGAWILENLLCQPPTEPSAEADAMGRALENFDVVGRYRTLDASGQPIVATVSLPAAGVLSGGQVDGLPGLSQALAASPAARECLAQKLYTYAFGRAFSAEERPNVVALSRAWQAGPPTLRELLLHLVLSPAFRQRGEGAEP